MDLAEELAEPELPVMTPDRKAASRFGHVEEAEVTFHREQRPVPRGAAVEQPVISAADVIAEPQAPIAPMAPLREQHSPFATQRTVNAPRAPKKGPSLFERLTGTGKRHEEMPAQQMRREPAMNREAPRAEPARPAPSLNQAEGNLVQPSYEEEQLEIPTFLRRQAN